MEKNIPKRRFKEFIGSGEWEEKKLGDISTLTSSKRIHRKDYKKEGIPFFRGLEISKLKNDENINDLIYISNEYYKQLQAIYGVPTIGDILITAVGTLGNTYLIKDRRQFYFKDGNLIWLKNINICSQYLNIYLGNGIGNKRVLESSSGSNQKALTIERLLNLKVIVPSLPEQEKIGNFFEKLDRIIDLNREKLEKLKNSKSAYLSEMFPKEGELYPKRRFVGFTEPWEEKKLGGIVEITMGQSPSSKNYTENPNDYVLVQGNADIKKGKVYPRVWTTQVTKQANKNDLILSVRAPVGDIGKTDYDVVLGRGVAGIKGNEFIFQLFNKMKEEEYWKILSTGSTFESINSNDLKNAHIYIPSIPEQEKIGNFFKKLDERIILQEEKIEKLENMKKAYLSEMFV